MTDADFKRTIQANFNLCRNVKVIFKLRYCENVQIITGQKCKTEKSFGCGKF